MDNLFEVAKHYLRLIAEEDRKKNTDILIKVQGGRTIYFWDARLFAKQIGINDYELNKVVEYLSKRDLLYWRHNYGEPKTVELTEKGFKWGYHESLFSDEKNEVNKQNTIEKKALCRFMWVSSFYYLTSTYGFNALKFKSPVNKKTTIL